jgi:hypothetical protein
MFWLYRKCKERRTVTRELEQVSFMHNASSAQQNAGVVGALVATINGKRPIAFETGGTFAVMSRHEADADGPAPLHLSLLPLHASCSPRSRDRGGHCPRTRSPAIETLGCPCARKNVSRAERARARRHLGAPPARCARAMHVPPSLEYGIRAMEPATSFSKAQAAAPGESAVVERSADIMLSSTGVDVQGWRGDGEPRHAIRALCQACGRSQHVYVARRRERAQGRHR